jgi:hypothetical protein
MENCLINFGVVALSQNRSDIEKEHVSLIQDRLILFESHVLLRFKTHVLM